MVHKDMLEGRKPVVMIMISQGQRGVDIAEQVLQMLVRMANIQRYTGAAGIDHGYLSENVVDTSRG